MLFFRLYSLRELDVHNEDEVLLTSLLLVSQYLRNTNRVPNAIEMCKEVLFLLEHKTLGNIDQTCVKRFENVHSHPIKRGTKRLFTFRQVFARKVELRTTCTLAELYQSQRKYSEAEGLYLKAIHIAEKIGNGKIVATSYGNLGFMFLCLGEHVKAKEYCEKAIAIAAKIGDGKIEAKSYEKLGGIFTSLGEYVKAKEHWEKALAIGEKIGNGKIVARSYGNLAVMFLFLGEHVKAKEHCEKALAIAEKTGDRKIEATIYGNLGGIFNNSFNEHVKAKEHYEKAITIAKEIGDRKTEAVNYQNLGRTFNNLGEYVKAKEHCEKALAIAEETRDRTIEATSYQGLGSIFNSLGEHVKAKEHCEKALAIAEQIGDQKTEATSYDKLGGIFTSLDDYVKAKEHCKKAIAIAEKTGDRETEARSYRNLGNIFYSLGEYVKAKEHFEKALEIAEKIGVGRIEALCHGSLGFIFFSLGEYAKAKECLEKNLVLKRKYGDSEDESICRLLLSHLMLKEGNISESKSNAFVSFNKVEDIRRLQVHDKFKILYFEKMFNNYRKFSQLLCDADFPHEALYTEEFRRARALKDLMAARYSVENEIPVSPQTWDYIESIVKKECNCACLYMSYHEQSFNFWVVKADNPLIFQQIKVNAVFGSVIRVADLLCREIYREVLCLAPEQCEDRSWLPSNAYWEQGCERLMLEDENEPPERTPACVYKMIIAPVADYLDEPEIIILPDRDLYKVPFAALEDESGKCLSESFRIRIVPSLTTLKLIQDSPADYHSQSGVLIVGDPAVGEVLYKEILQRVKRLPFANKEAEMIGKLFGTQPLLGKQATKEAVLQKIHSVSLIHFACHGNAERGEIILAPPPVTDGTPQEEDYLLTMEDISKVKLRAKLVVLSCCHSAKGQISAEGVVGIARAFLGSGARSVLAALWAIDDEATEHFMTHFYENLVHGESASESLQQAMKWMRENGFSKISQWAPFMLIGDNVKLDIHKLRSSKGH
ncbi:unnamed protein product [Porites lobata]|uniref:CHAT domain-containing protein n=1 Tax=Porites lobata TaxID=104759 RepID=A0ABN8PZD6_9CNID|nr:unnamed protein product [Porites lobata]